MEELVEEGDACSVGGGGRRRHGSIGPSDATERVTCGDASVDNFGDYNDSDTVVSRNCAGTEGSQGSERIHVEEDEFVDYNRPSGTVTNDRSDDGGSGVAPHGSFNTVACDGALVSSDSTENSYDHGLSHLLRVSPLRQWFKSTDNETRCLQIDLDRDGHGNLDEILTENSSLFSSGLSSPSASTAMGTPSTTSSLFQSSTVPSLSSVSNLNFDPNEKLKHSDCHPHHLRHDFCNDDQQLQNRPVGNTASVAEDSDVKHYRSGYFVSQWEKEKLGASSNETEDDSIPDWALTGRNIFMEKNKFFSILSTKKKYDEGQDFIDEGSSSPPLLSSFASECERKRIRNYLNLFLLLSSLAFSFGAQNLIAPNMSMIARSFHFDDMQRDEWIGGTLTFLFYTPGAGGALFVGLCAGLIRRKLLFSIVVCFTAAACFCTSFVTTFLQLAILRTFTGLGIGGILPLAFSLIGDWFEPQQRASASAFVMGSCGVGAFIGQCLAAVFGKIDWRWPFFFVSIPAFVMGLLFGRLVHENDADTYQCSGDYYRSVINNGASAATAHDDIDVRDVGRDFRGAPHQSHIHSHNNHFSWGLGQQHHHDHHYHKNAINFGHPHDAIGMGRHDVCVVGHSEGVAPTGDCLDDSGRRGNARTIDQAKQYVSLDYQNNREYSACSLDSTYCNGTRNNISDCFSQINGMGDIFNRRFAKKSQQSSDDCLGSSHNNSFLDHHGCFYRNQPYGQSYIQAKEQLYDQTNEQGFRQSRCHPDIFPTTSGSDYLEKSGKNRYALSPSTMSSLSPNKDAHHRHRQHYQHLDLSSLRQMMRKKTSMLMLLQAFPGNIAWGILIVYLHDFLRIDIDMSSADALAAISAVAFCSFCGMVSGGFIGEELYKKQKRYLCYFCTIVNVLRIFPFFFLFGLKIYFPHLEGAKKYIPIFCLLMFGGFLSTMTTPNIGAILLNVNPPQVRGTIFGIYTVLDDLSKAVGTVFVSFLIGVLNSRGFAFQLSMGFWIVSAASMFACAWTFPEEEAAMLREQKKFEENRYGGSEFDINRFDVDEKLRKSSFKCDSIRGTREKVPLCDSVPADTDFGGKAERRISDVVAYGAHCSEADKSGFGVGGGGAATIGGGNGAAIGGDNGAVIGGGDGAVIGGGDATFGGGTAAIGGDDAIIGGGDGAIGVVGVAIGGDGGVCGKRTWDSKHHDTELSDTSRPPSSLPSSSLPSSSLPSSSLPSSLSPSSSLPSSLSPSSLSPSSLSPSSTSPSPSSPVPTSTMLVAGPGTSIVAPSPPSPTSFTSLNGHCQFHHNHKDDVALGAYGAANAGNQRDCREESTGGHSPNDDDETEFGDAIDGSDGEWEAHASDFRGPPSLSSTLSRFARQSQQELLLPASSAAKLSPKKFSSGFPVVLPASLTQSLPPPSFAASFPFSALQNPHDPLNDNFFPPNSIDESQTFVSV